MNQRAEIRADACARVQARLCARCDGGLDAAATARDEGHVEACAACAADEAAWRAALLELARPIPGSDAALAGLEQRLDRLGRPATRAARRGLPAKIALAAAAALLLYAAVSVAARVDERTTLDSLVSGGRELGRVRLPPIAWDPSAWPAWWPEPATGS